MPLVARVFPPGQLHSESPPPPPAPGAHMIVCTSRPRLLLLLMPPPRSLACPLSSSKVLRCTGLDRFRRHCSNTLKESLHRYSLYLSPLAACRCSIACLKLASLSPNPPPPRRVGNGWMGAYVSLQTDTQHLEDPSSYRSSTFPHFPPTSPRPGSGLSTDHRSPPHLRPLYRARETPSSISHAPQAAFLEQGNVCTVHTYIYHRAAMC